MVSHKKKQHFLSVCGNQPTVAAEPRQVRKDKLLEMYREFAIELHTGPTGWHGMGLGASAAVVDPLFLNQIRIELPIP